MTSDSLETAGIVRERLDDLFRFEGSATFRVYGKTLADDIHGIEEAILAFEPVKLDDLLEIRAMHSKRQVLLAQARIFEEYRAVLEQKLGELP